MTDPARNGNGVLKLIATLGAAVGFATAMTMGTIAANERADRADRKAEAAETALAAYREETAGRLARLETTQDQNVSSVQILREHFTAQDEALDKWLQQEFGGRIAPLIVRLDHADERLRSAEERATLWVPRIIRLETLMEKEAGK